MSLSDKFPYALFAGIAAGEKHVAFIGDVSVGKSSLLNRLFGLALPAGADHTTMHVESVCKLSNVVMWDTPGQNTDKQALLPAEAIQVLRAMDLIVILYTSDLNTVTDLCDLIKVLNLPTALKLRSGGRSLSPTSLPRTSSAFPTGPSSTHTNTGCGMRGLLKAN